MQNVNIIQNGDRKYVETPSLSLILSCMCVSLTLSLSRLLMHDALDILSVICDKLKLLKALSVCVRVCVPALACVSYVTGATLGYDNFRRRV